MTSAGGEPAQPTTPELRGQCLLQIDRILKSQPSTSYPESCAQLASAVRDLAEAYALLGGMPPRLNKEDRQ